MLWISNLCSLSGSNRLLDLPIHSLRPRDGVAHCFLRFSSNSLVVEEMRLGLMD
ncbi:hypothetical protein KIN20_026873 [Parelaphostrongylus tenuis]|uniref:Uncharacterized protein n=1 Tax=Parelaphostrongylus tenuis TaxID=148309 RepID=A0AAD5WD74_PARTN|nr:hypothetical protein KIN20_026873 [Parelaphostrongylus tenuis]